MKRLEQAVGILLTAPPRRDLTHFIEPRQETVSRIGKRHLDQVNHLLDGFHGLVGPVIPRQGCIDDYGPHARIIQALERLENRKRIDKPEHGI